MIAYVNFFKRGYVPRGLGSSSQKVNTSLPRKMSNKSQIPFIIMLLKFREYMSADIYFYINKFHILYKYSCSHHKFTK